MLRYTLLSDGSSDRALGWVIHRVVESLMRELRQSEAIDLQWADFRSWPEPPHSLEARIERAIEYFACDILFIHRDAEGASLAVRSREIQQALAGRQLRGCRPVQVIPVRMTEAWLLIDATAIRRAAGNPRSHVDLGLPKINAIEGKADPKLILHQALLKATEYTGRRKDRFNVDAAVHRVAELIDDFRPLRRLSAFRAFETDTRNAFNSWLASRG